MCAYVDLKATQDFVKKNKGNHKIRVYKYLRFRGRANFSIDMLIAPYKYTEYKPGINKSDSRSKLQNRNNIEINKGIHTYLSSKNAYYHRPYTAIVVGFTADIYDLICVGYGGEAVWKKVTMTERSYKDAIKRGKLV